MRSNFLRVTFQMGCQAIAIAIAIKLMIMSALVCDFIKRYRREVFWERWRFPAASAAASNWRKGKYCPGTSTFQLFPPDGPINCVKKKILNILLWQQQQQQQHLDFRFLFASQVARCDDCSYKSFSFWFFAQKNKKFPLSALGKSKSRHCAFGSGSWVVGCGWWSSLWQWKPHADLWLTSLGLAPSLVAVVCAAFDGASSGALIVQHFFRN